MVCATTRAASSSSGSPPPGIRNWAAVSYAPADGDALRHDLGIDRRRDPRRGRRRPRRHAARGRSTTSGPPGSPRHTSPPGSVPTPRSRCTSTTATSTSRRSTARSRCAACRSTSTTATSTRSCGTCSTTPMPRRWSSTPRSATGWRGWSIGCRSCGLLVEVDDGASGQVDGARRYEEVVAAHEPMERIVRSEDDIYMLYTGGTTGMPKGVMYRIGDHTSLFLNLGFPAVGLAPPSRSAEVPGSSADHRRRHAVISIPSAPLMHGTGLWLGCFVAHLAGGAVVTLTSRSLDAARGAARRPGQPCRPDRDRRRRVREAAHPRDRRGGRARRAVRPVVAQDDHLVGRDVDDRGERAAPRPDPAADADRRHRIDRGLDRQPGHDPRRRHRDRQVRPATRPPRSSPRTAARSSPDPTRSA